MDLLEARSGGTRHPWELSRARAVETIARRHAHDAPRAILDWGCGDAFTGRFLLERLGAERLVGIDPNLTEAQAAGFGAGDARVALVRGEHELPRERYDLVLCCDVIEHLPDDGALLGALRRSFLAPSGRLIVTVPAFQQLFSQHDVALKHFRRYSLGELESAVRRAGFDVLGSGYLFATLLPIRAASGLLAQRFSRQPSDDGVGLGRWRAGPLTTRAVETVLLADNTLLLALARLGLKLPGLSAWAACSPSG